jgi:hypothetical protein
MAPKDAVACLCLLEQLECCTIKTSLLVFYGWLTSFQLPEIENGLRGNITDTLLLAHCYGVLTFLSTWKGERRFFFWSRAALALALTIDSSTSICSSALRRRFFGSVDFQRNFRHSDQEEGGNIPKFLLPKRPDSPSSTHRQNLCFLLLFCFSQIFKIISTIFRFICTEMFYFAFTRKETERIS